jgi:transposase InsO family protein
LLWGKIVIQASDIDGGEIPKPDLLRSRKSRKFWWRRFHLSRREKPVRYRFRRNRVIVGAMDDEWEADLVIMDSLSQQNNGYTKYVLTVIDVLSKYAWVEAIKAKTGNNLVKAFEKIIKKGHKPKMFHTDKGTEFINRQFQTFLKKHDIQFFTTYNETKASIVERFNRTLKTKMWKYFTANNTLKYVDILQKLVKSYNHSRHRSIGTRPIDVNKNNENIVWQTLYGKESKNQSSLSLTLATKSGLVKQSEHLRKDTCPIGLKKCLR